MSSASKRKRSVAQPATDADAAPAPAAAAAPAPAAAAAAAAPASAGKATRASSRTAAKNYLNQLFADDKGTATPKKQQPASAKKKANAPAAAVTSSATAPDSSEQPQAKKKKVAAAASKSGKAAEPASSASDAASASSQSKSKSSSSSSSVPPFPVIPSDLPLSFDASAPLARSSAALYRAVWDAHMTLVDGVYGGGKHAGKHQYIANACRDVGESFLEREGLEADVAAVLAEDGGDAAATAEGPLLENPINAALRGQIAQVSALKAQQAKDIAAWTEHVARLQAEADAELARGPLELDDVPLSAEEEAFLASHRGGDLAKSVTRAVTNQRVKGDASLHALERLQGLIAGVTADQRAMSTRINAEEKKAYGAALDDPRDLIAMLTGGGGGGGDADDAPAAAASSSS